MMNVDQVSHGHVFSLRVRHGQDKGSNIAYLGWVRVVCAALVPAPSVIDSLSGREGFELDSAG